MSKKKSKSKVESKGSKKSPPVKAVVLDPRAVLLAQVAGSVAANLVNVPSPSITSAGGIATIAVDIAEEILKKAGIAAAAEAPVAAENAADLGEAVSSI